LKKKKINTNEIRPNTVVRGKRKWNEWNAFKKSNMARNRVCGVRNPSASLRPINLLP